MEAAGGARGSVLNEANGVQRSSNYVSSKVNGVQRSSNYVSSKVNGVLGVRGCGRKLGPIRPGKESACRATRRSRGSTPWRS